jgi:hypothetical protein
MYAPPELPLFTGMKKQNALFLLNESISNLNTLFPKEIISN